MVKHKISVSHASVVAAVASAVVLVCAAGAQASVGTPIALGPANGGASSVAVDSAGTAYIAWTNHTTVKQISFCRLPVGATSCQPLVQIPTPSAAADFLDPPTVMLSGGDVYLFEQVFEGSDAHENGILEYVSSTNPIAFTQAPDYAVSFPGNTGDDGVVHLPNGLIGVGYGATETYPVFQANSLGSPVEYSEATFSENQANNPFALLGGSAYPADDIGESWFGVQPSGSSEGVLGVTQVDNSGICPVGDGSGVAYEYAPMTASTTVAQLNTSTGTAGSPWQPIGVADCDGTLPAVAGGPSGLGLLDLDYGFVTNGHGTGVYRAFSPSSGFGAPVSTGLGNIAGFDALAQDGSGGIYATAYNGNGLALAYSANAGHSFAGPETLFEGSGGFGGALQSMAVGSGGQGWQVFYSENGSAGSGNTETAAANMEYAVPFGKITATPTSIATSQSFGRSKGAKISIVAGATGETDRATLSGPNARTAGGSVHYYLYAADKCDPGKSAVFDGGASPVTNGLAAPSKPVSVALAPGKYDWQADYSGDGENEASVSACGAEVLTVVPFNGIGGTATSNGSTASLPVSCATVPCSGTATLTSPVGGEAAAGRRTAKPVTIASGHFKIRSHGKKTVTLKLTRAGKRLLRGKRSYKADVVVSEKVDGHAVSTHATVTIKRGK
jgi:hypothetical protein